MNTSLNIKWQKFKLRPITLCLGLCGALLGTIIPAQAAKHSLVIAVDGLRGDGIKNSSTPNIDQLIKGNWAPDYQGAFAHYAQTMKDAAPNSGPNHVGIMTGVTSTKHGVTSNSDISSGNYTSYPHYQTLLEDHNSALNTAYLVTWGTDMQITNKADLKVDANDAGNVQRVVDIVNGSFSSTSWPLGAQPDSIFLFLDDVDHAGHACCFTSSDQGYRAEISDVDNQIGRILTAIKDRPHFITEDWQIVITSDHGGRGSSHGIHAADNYTIPFLVASKDVKQGYLAGVPNNFDAAPTALAHLGVVVPINMDGKVRGNNVIEQAPNELKQDLVTYIPFSSDYNDASGNDIHGSVGAGTPELKNGGKFGRYVAIDGNQEYITLGNPSEMDFASNTDFTLFTWYRVAGDQNGDPVIIGNKDWNSGGNRGVALLANANDGDDAGINIASSSNDRTDLKFIDYSYNGWWLLAATFDRDGVATLYAGDPKGQLHIIADDIREVGDLTSSLNWNVGQDGTGSYKYNLKADLDDFAIWRRALTMEEISVIYDQGNGVELNQLFFNKQTKYLTSEFDFIAGENYRVAITAKANKDKCGFNLSEVITSDESNAYWDCTSKTNAMVLKVSHVAVGNNGEKKVSGTLVTDSHKGALVWHSDMNNHERNAKFNFSSAGDPITVEFVNDATDTRLFSRSGDKNCGLEWDSSIKNQQRNAKWDCTPNSNPLRFELLADLVEPPVTGPTKLIAHFPLDTSSADVSGNGHIGNIDGNVTFSRQGDRQYAEFNNNGMIAMAVGDILPSLPIEAITVSTWVNTKNADNWGGFIGLIQDNGSFEKGWLLGTRGQKFSFALTSKTSGSMTYLVDNSTFELNKWYHLTATYDGNIMKLYVDGRLKTVSEAQKGNIDMPTSGWWQIGSYKDDNEDFRHDGSLDDIKLFDQALTEDQIKDLIPTILVETIGDFDSDMDVDRNDISLLMQAINQPATGENIKKDLDGDGTITVLDARKLVSLCTRMRCATES